MKTTDYLKRILTARVYDVAIESALEPAAGISAAVHNHVLLKREDTSRCFPSSCVVHTTKWRT